MANVKFSAISSAAAISKATDTIIGVQGSATDVQYVMSDVLAQAPFNVARISGNTSGTTASFSSGTIVLAGGNNITLSQSSNTITISAAAQTNQQLSLFAVSNTTLSTSGTQNASALSFEGAGGVSVGVSNGSVVISGGAGGGGGNNTAGISNLGNTSGTSGVISGSAVELLFAGGNNVTLSQSINGSTATITISAAAQTNQTVGLYAVSNTTLSTSRTADARSISFEGAGAISVGVSNGSVIISGNAAAADGVNVIEISGNTSGTTTSFSSATIAFAGGNNITLSQSSNTITISGAAFSTLTQGNMVTISTAGSSVTVDAFANILSASGNTSGTLTTFSSGTMVLAGGNNITLSQSSNTITISGASQSNQRLSMFAVSNTTLSTSGTQLAGALSFEGAGGVSVGVSNGSVVISGGAGGGGSTLTAYAVSNTTLGTSGTLNITAISFDAAGAASLGVSNGSIVVSAPNQSFLIAGNNISLSSNSNSITIADLITQVSVSQLEPWDFGNNTSASSLGQSSLYLQHMNVPDNLQLCRMDRLMSLSLNAAVSGSTLSTGTRSNVWNYNETLGLYSRGTGTNSTNLYSYMSNSWSFGITESISIFTTVNLASVGLAQSYTIGFVGNIDTAGGTTSSTFTATGSTSSAGVTVSQANVLSNASGVLLMNAPFGSNLLSGGDYWYAALAKTATTTGGTSTNLASVSNIVLTNFNSDLQRLGQTATATSNTLIPGNGAFTAQTAAFPSSIAISAISNNSNASLYGNFMNVSL